MNAERKTVNPHTRNLERLAGMLGVAAAIFAAMAVLWWRGRASIALLGCTASLTALGYSIYSSARKAIDTLESAQSNLTSPKGESP